jgi:hypothetical protein
VITFGLVGLVSAVAIAVMSHVNRAATATHLVEQFHDWQDRINSTYQHEVVEQEDHPLFAGLSAAPTSELHRHAVNLGSTVMRIRGEPIAVLRVFTDEARTTLLYVMTGMNWIAAESYTDDEELVTFGVPRYWVHPPFLKTQVVEAAPLPERLAAHRAWVAASEPGPLHRFERIGDAIRLWARFREREIAWRSEQDPDKLAEEELRLMLGEDFKKYWPLIRKKLRAEIPKAQVKR